MTEVRQPEFGRALEFKRRIAGPGGGKLSRGAFGETIGMTSTQVRNIEQGRQLKPGEYERIIEAYPVMTDPWAGYGGLTVDDESPKYGDLVAFSDELEDPESQEAVADEVTSTSHRVEAVAPPATRSTVFFSNSEIQTFKRCRRKWWLGWYRRLELRAEDPVGALATGRRVHRALQAWYVPEGDEPVEPREALNRVVASDWAAATSAYKERGTEPPLELVKEFNKSVELERAMVEGYLEWLAETGVDSNLSVIAPETYLEAPIDVPGVDVDVKIIGKIDVRVRRETDGTRMFVDHKTVGSLTEPLKTIRMDPQMLHYHLLEWLQDVDEGRCDGALYNMLKKVKRTQKANPPFFDRVEVRHNQYELESFRRQLVGVIRTMIEVRARLDAGEDPIAVVYPTPNKNCSWDCEFRLVCSLFDDGSRVEHMVDQYYVEGDPYSYYTEEEE